MTPIYSVGSNYNVTVIATSTGTISPATITLTAVSDSKVYNGTTTSSKTPTYQVTSFNARLGEQELGLNSLYNADTFSSLSESFNSPFVPLATTMIATGNIGSNYIVDVSNTASGNITPAPLTVTADPESKT